LFHFFLLWHAVTKSHYFAASLQRFSVIEKWEGSGVTLVSRRQTLYTDQARTSLYRVCCLPRGPDRGAALLYNRCVARVRFLACTICFLSVTNTVLRKKPLKVSFW
jgi:hypothetical protein